MEMSERFPKTYNTLKKLAKVALDTTYNEDLVKANIDEWLSAQSVSYLLDIEEWLETRSESQIELIITDTETFDPEYIYKNAPPLTEEFFDSFYEEI